jgi:ribosomal protein S18 acetylase RimI-like enzyme
MQIIYRVGKPDDLRTFLVLMREFYEEDRHDFEEDKARLALVRFVADHQWGYAWLIEVEGTIAGYVVLTYGYSFEFGGRDATIDELYLRKLFRGQGIGRQIVEHVINVCREHGIQALHLEVEAHNTRALEFYRAMGFVTDDSTLMSQYL